MLTSPHFRRLFLPYLLLICAATGAVGVFGAMRFRAGYLERQEEALQNSARLLSGLLADAVVAEPREVIDAEVREIAQTIGRRITMIRGDGAVIADSHADAQTMDDHRLRPEVIAAAAEGRGTDVRTSETTGTAWLYLVLRMEDAEGRPVLSPRGEPYFMRVAAPLQPLQHDLRVLYGALAAAAGLATLAAGVICYYFVRRHTAPLLELARFAEAISHGDLKRRSMSAEKGEMNMLARALNSMADSISRLLSQTEKDKAELVTILSSMSEGVIATDGQQRVLLVNEAAARLFGFSRDEVAGKRLWQIVRNEQVLKAAAEVLEGNERKLISVSPAAARHLQVTISTFPGDGPAAGLVIVGHDVTQSVQYQDLRKEFVANVSHELRTPLTVIKGFVETLKDGALHDPVKGPQYLETIERHAGQLSNLVNDLLELSRLESQPQVPRRSEIDLAPIVHRVEELLLQAVQKKGQTLAVKATGRPLQVVGNADYLERAIANLVDNAIKYTPAGGSIEVAGKVEDGRAVVEVSDTGIGIPEADLGRIFERFYRVDRSRSREMGGTGLGLSIVKHIAQSHGGTVEVRSTPGKGSTFRLVLPMRDSGSG